MKNPLCVFLAAAVGIPVASARPTVVVEADAADGYPGLVVVETMYYRIAFDRAQQGGEKSAWHKKWDIDMRAEDYYAAHMPLFHPFVIQADPDPITGLTRRMRGEHQRKGLVRASHTVLEHSDEQIVLEFEWQNPKSDDAPEWMRHLVHRKRLFLRDDSPAIRVEYEVENTDAEARSVLVIFWNSASQGRVQVRTVALAHDGMRTGVDTAHEGTSSEMLLPKIAGNFLGGVSEKGTGVGYSYRWSEIDAIQIGNFKTVGSTYHAMMRRRPIEAGEKLVHECWFMPFSGLPSLDGMEKDLAGGIALEPRNGAPTPLSVALVSGSPRTVTVNLSCVRLEDGKSVLAEQKQVPLGIDAVQTLESALVLDGDGLYALTVSADDGAGTILRMERAVEVGVSRKAWLPTPPPGAKLGTADASETLYPPRMHTQFRTVDRAMVTPHIPFLANHARGTVKAYFLTHANPTLCHVREIVQRGDFEYDYAAAEIIVNPKGALNELALQEFAASYNAYAPEVLVLLGIDVENGLGDTYFRHILKRVEHGMGLVLQTPPPSRNSRLARAMDEWQVVETASFSCIATPKSATASRPQHFRHGNGRIVLYPVPQRNYRDEGEMVLNDWKTLGAATVEEDGWRGFEYVYAHLADQIRWAAAKESPVRIVGATATGKAITITVENSATHVIDATVAVTVRTRDWEASARAGQDVRLAVGTGTHALTLDRDIMSGASALEITVRGADGKTLAFGSQAVAGGPTAITIAGNPLARERAHPGDVTLALTGHPGAGTLRVRLVDRFGRQVQETAVAVPDNAEFTATVALDGARALDIYHEIRADFIPVGAEHPLARGCGRVALMPAKMPYEYRYVAAVAGAPERKTKHIQGMLDACRQGHLEMHTHAIDFATMYRSGGYSAGYVFTGAKGYKLDQSNAMTPPLVQSAETIATRKEKWQETARRQVDNGARTLLLDDERRFSGEWDYSEATMTAFREHVRGRYTTVAALNKAWETDFADFDAVMPKPLAALEATESANRAQWLEHRMFCGEILAQNHIKLPHDWAKAIDPRLAVGELGIYSASALYPVDWAKYAKYYEHTQRYAMADEFRSFAPGVNHGIWTGYGWTSFKPPQRLAVWQSLLDGGHWVWFWEMRSDGNLWYAVLTSDLRLTEPYEVICTEELPDIQGGLDQMIIASIDQDQDVAVAYSYPSLMLGGDKGRRSPGIAGESCSILRALGTTYRFVDLKGEAMATLGEDPYRLLVAQHLPCVGEDEAKHIETFAAAGHAVLVIGRLGWLDPVGTPHAGGALGDRLCGIDTSASSYLGQPMATRWHDIPIRVVAERSGVGVVDAEVLVSGKIDGAEVPMLTRRSVGKGTVYWLNSTLDGQVKVFAGGIAGEEEATVAGPEAIRRSHLAIYRHILATAGVESTVRLARDGTEIESGEVWTYLSPSGRSRYVALCPNTTEPDVHARLHFRDGPAHVYNLRTQAYAGHVSEFDESFPLCRMQAYALLPYQVASLDVEVDATDVAAGETVTVAFRITTAGAEADLHGIRVAVFAPDGAEIEAHRTVVLARNGQAVQSLPLALNAAKGAYTVKAMDCVSGLRAEAVFRVQ